MKQIIALVLGLAVVLTPVLGCKQEASTQKKTTVQTPEGKTTVTEKKSVEKSGENPPAVPPGTK